MHGVYRFKFADGREFIIPNKIVDEGSEAIAKMVLHGDNSIVAGGGNFYVGLTSGTPDDNTLLSTLAGEPVVANGYARKPVVRQAADWTLSKINGIWRGQTGTITWTPSGTWASGFIRAFLCNVSAGSAGKLFAYSAAMPALYTPSIALGPFQAQYELWFD